jgi:hypothetical protein
MKIKALTAALLVLALAAAAQGLELERDVDIEVNDTGTTIYLSIEGGNQINCTYACEYDLEETIDCGIENLTDYVGNLTDYVEELQEDLEECQGNVSDNVTYIAGEIREELPGLRELIEERCTASEVVQANLDTAVDTYRAAIASYWNETYLPTRDQMDQITNARLDAERELKACQEANALLNETATTYKEGVRRLQVENNWEFWIIVILVLLWAFSRFWGRRAEFFGRERRIKKKAVPQPLPYASAKPDYMKPTYEKFKPPEVEKKKKKRGLIGRFI